MLDHPVCADTAGRFLMAGLRDGSVNVNNLMVRMTRTALDANCVGPVLLSLSSLLLITF